MLNTNTTHTSLMSLLNIAVLYPNLAKSIVNCVHNKENLFDTIQSSSICPRTISLLIINMLLLHVPITHLLMYTLLLNPCLLLQNGLLTLVFLIMSPLTFKTFSYTFFIMALITLWLAMDLVSILLTRVLLISTTFLTLFMLSNVLCVPNMKNILIFISKFCAFNNVSI